MLTEHDRAEEHADRRDTTVLIVATEGTPAAWVGDVREALDPAGTDGVRLIWLTEGWASEGVASLAADAGLLDRDPDEDVGATIPGRLGDLLAGLDEPERAAERLDALCRAGLADLDDADAEAGTPPVLGGAVQLVLVSGAEPETPLGQLATAVARRLADVGPGRVVAAQGMCPPGLEEERTEDERRTTFVGPIRTSERARAAVSTIDHLDRPGGASALALAVADLAEGRIGHYGLGPGATARRPARAPRHRKRRAGLAGWVDAVVQAPAESWIGAGVTLGCMVFVVAQLHPDLLIAKTTPAGGDMGAHVWGPAYLRDHLLPEWRLTGWTPDWYAGFPAFHFYMLPPALLILLLDVLLPYGVAMKLVTVAGVVALPLCAYVMGRLLRMPFPAPPLLAVAMVPFLFDRTWTIYGGNIASTLAGEYSFSISLSLALLFFGVLGRGLETGRHRGLATLLLALTILCHAIPAFFAVAGGAVLVLLRLDRKRIAFAAPILVLGCLLTAFWSIPFILRRGYLTDMGWEQLRTFNDALLPDGTRWVLVLALVGVVLALAFWIRAGVFFAVLGLLFAAGFLVDAASPVHIWNARLLPFYYLCLYLLAAVGVAEVVRSLAIIVDGRRDWRRRTTEAVGAVLALGAGLVVVGLPLRSLPFGEVKPDGTYEWLFTSTSDNSFVDSWAEWNYSGYERKDAYPEYRSIMATMQEVGEEEGCGRAHWEYEEDLNRYGTPMAMMLLPHWTDGCIGSMEGLYFESSGTTPFHFLNAAETSVAPSNPVRSFEDRPMPYSQFDLDRGVEHLQLLGVRYYLAFSDQAVAAADAHPDLTPVAESPPWHVYEIAGSELVEPLRYEPAVLEGMEPLDSHAWQKDAVEWYVDPEATDVVLAPDGPSEWQRIERGDDPERRELPRTRVSNIDEDDLSISFDVDRPGEPVLVKTSYFPNWEVSGAEGPYRVTPNLMVVVPTEEHVELTYGNTSVEYLGYGLTAAAAAGTGLLAWRGPVTFPPRRRREEGEGRPRSTGWQPAVWPPPGDGSEDDAPEPEPVGFWDSLLAERKAELAEAEQRAKDAPEDRGPSGPPLLDPDRDLGDDEPGPLRP